MATTASFYPSTVSLNDWSHISDAYAPSNNYATAAPGRNSSKVAHLGNFGSTLPPNSTITSCVIEAKYKVSTTLSTPVLGLAVLNSDARVGDQSRFTDSPATDVTVTHSCEGITTTTQTANGTFEVEVIAARGDDTDAVLISLDYIKATFVFSANVTAAVTGNAATSAAGTQTITLGTASNSTLSSAESTSTGGIVSIAGNAGVSPTGNASVVAAQALDAGQWYTGELVANEITSAVNTPTATWGSGITLEGA